MRNLATLFKGCILNDLSGQLCLLPGTIIFDEYIGDRTRDEFVPLISPSRRKMLNFLSFDALPS